MEAAVEEVKAGGATTLAAGLLDRLRGAWRDLAGTLGASNGSAIDATDTETLRARMQDCLEGRGGEVSARARAALLGRSYLGLDDKGKLRFLRLLADEFGNDPAKVDAAMAAVSKADGRAARLTAERKLCEALESPRMRLLTQFSTLPEGVKFLVDMRAEILNFSRSDPAMGAFESELKELLAAWFDVGFLELQRITWRSPALVLEKIASYEAVHAIKSWQDLKNRLDSDRRFFAFFHPRMPDEPLIFLEVALVRGMAGNIHDLLDEQAPVGDPARADTAIFYSISSAQRGLAGISFGNFLIKRVVDDLSREFPNLKTFATLSPIPGFRAWLNKKLAEGEDGVLSKAELRMIGTAARQMGATGGLKELLGTSWRKNADIAEKLESPVTRLAAAYLVETTKNGRALDSVAHFHLTNGARLERLNWLGDVSEKGMAQSLGLMANYLYRLGDIESNHEAYSGRGRVVTSSTIKALAGG